MRNTATKKKKESPEIKPAAPGYLVINKEEPKYIGNTKTGGIKIDWSEIFKIYNSLGCPKDVYNPSTLPIDKAAWFVLTSERNTGKTTNLILLSMILNLKYGMISAYLRESSDEVTPKEMANFMNVIINNGYVQKLTNGEYNGVRFWARHYRFVKWTPDGKREKESEPFLWVGAVTEWSGYRSTLNLPLCNFILYDEFITEHTPPDLFIGLCQIIKTIGRNRSGVKIFLCANTTNYYHEFFQELLIQEEVLNCGVNQDFIKVTPLGTSVYYRRIGDMDPQREAINREYFGLSNPKLKSITGGDWAIKNYPHAQHDDEKEVIYDKAAIRFMLRHYQIELCRSEKLGLYCIVHPVRDIKKSNIIYTIEEITERKEKYCFGDSKIDKLLWSLYNKNKWYYSTNDVGFSVETYVNRANDL